MGIVVFPNELHVVSVLSAVSRAVHVMERVLFVFCQTKPDAIEFRGNENNQLWVTDSLGVESRDLFISRSIVWASWPP